MRLFDVPAGKYVRITSKLIRWVENGIEQTISEGVTWTGVTTDRYFYYKGASRRLLINHSINWPEFGIWQIDTEVEIIEFHRR